MSLAIIAVGKKHEGWVADGIRRYQKRLAKPWDIEWVLLSHSTLDGDKARQNESVRILNKLPPHEYVVLLDERGTMLDSPTLSKLCEQQFIASRHVTIVIGGAYGVSDKLRERADTVWSLSPLVFPHQLVRLILIEQLYRAQEISLGHPYHHQ